MKNNQVFWVLANFLAILFFTQISFAQCKIKTDEFTGVVSIENDLKKIGKSKDNLLDLLKYLRAYLSVVGNVIALTVCSENERVFSLKENEPFYLKFVDGQVLKLTFLDTTIADTHRGEPFTQGTEKFVWMATNAALLTTEEFYLIGTIPLEKVRCGGVDFKINNPNVLLEQYRCIMDVLNRK